ncbi:MAG: hypothetical protein GY796_01840 [Chloroflexi bacterium]|nr:hypothetical protein [Chloroflexota bacterium]
MKNTLQLHIILIIVLLFLAACGSDTVVEPTPILPPPNVSISDGAGSSDDTAVSPTLEPGQLPEATAVPDDNPTAEPTPTLEPTATAVGEILPPPVTDPPVQVVTSSPLPAFGRDLLFIGDGAFKRWNHNSSRIEQLLPGPDPAQRIRSDKNRYDDFVGDITQFSVSGDGKRAAVVRLAASNPVTRTNSSGNPYPAKDTRHELWFVDLVSGESWLLTPRIDNLHNIALSHDARHVAFIGSSLNGANIFGKEGEPVRHVYFLATNGGSPGPVVYAAACNLFCSQMAWHPDNNLFVWNDAEAVWMRNLAGNEPEPLLPNKTFGVHTDNPGEAVVYAPIEWANNGRYLLLWKGGWEGGSRAVFDVPTNAVAEIPNTFVYVNVFPAEVMWLPDDRLSVLTSESSDSALLPTIALWRFHPEQATIVEEESLLLTNQRYGAAGQQHLDNGRFAYALFGEVPLSPEAGLYHLTSLNEISERVNTTPPVQFIPGAGQASWAKDGSGAIILPGDGSRVYYGPAEGEFLYDVTAVLGADPHAYQWQPEIVVP